MERDGMKVTVWKDSPDNTLFRIMNYIWGVPKQPNKARLYASDDSIHEAEQYVMLCEIPRSVAMQIVTHRKKHRNYSWMSSARPDLAVSLTTEYSRTQIVRLAMVFTPRGIIDMAHYRMCTKAEEPTRRFMWLLKDAIHEIEPALADLMMPMCAYRNGLCTMLRSCKHPAQYEAYVKPEAKP